MSRLARSSTGPRTAVYATVPGGSHGASSIMDASFAVAVQRDDERACGWPVPHRATTGADPSSAARVGVVVTARTVEEVVVRRSDLIRDLFATRP